MHFNHHNAMYKWLGGLLILGISLVSASTKVPDCPVECACVYSGPDLIVSCMITDTYPTLWPANGTEFNLNFAVGSMSLPADALRGITGGSFNFTGNIGTISAGAFQDLTDIRLIHFDDADLATIEAGAFRNLAELGQVTFSRCSINEIEPDAFIELSGADKFSILFEATSISVIHTTAFKNLLNISSIQFIDTPISKIEAYAFTLNSLGTLLFKTEEIGGATPLGTIHKDAFRGIQYLDLLSFDSIGGAGFDTDGFEVTSGLFQHLNVTVIRFNYVLIPAIRTGAFRATNMSRLYIFNCKIDEVQSKSFHEIQNTDRMLFQGTSIKKIRSYAFADIAGLNLLKFFATRMQKSLPVMGEIESRAFSNIEVLQFEFSSSLMLTQFAYHLALDSSIFHQIRGLERFSVSKAEVTYIKRDTFLDMQVDAIYFSDSKIGHIHNGAFNSYQNITRLQFIDCPTEKISENAFATNYRIENVLLYGIGRIEISPYFGEIEPKAFDGIMGGVGSFELLTGLTSDLHVNGLRLTSGIFSADITKFGKIKIRNCKILNIQGHAFHSTSVNNIEFMSSDIDAIDTLAFHSLTNVNSVTFIDGRITRISTKGFHDIQSTGSISFINSGEIKEIETDAFSNVIGLDLMLFDRTPISLIQLGAFSGLENVDVFNLSSSRVDCMYSDSFSGFETLYFDSDDLPCYPLGNESALSSKHCQADNAGGSKCVPVTSTRPESTTATPPYTTDMTPHKKVNPMLIWLPILIIGFLFIVGGGLYYKSKMNKQSKKSSPVKNNKKMTEALGQGATSPDDLHIHMSNGDLPPPYDDLK